MTNNSVSNFRFFAYSLLFSASMLGLTNSAYAGFVYTPAEPKPVEKKVPPAIITHDRSNAVDVPQVEITEMYVETGLDPVSNDSPDIVSIEENVIISENNVEVIEPIDTKAIQAVIIESEIEIYEDVNPVVIEEIKPVGSVASIANDNRILQGFGVDLPLKIAISQIAPTGYSVSLSKEVNENDPVSWSGGKSWDKVLFDALNGSGLRANVSNNHIAINKLGEVVNNISAPIIEPNYDGLNKSPNLMDFPVISAPIQYDAPEDRNSIVNETKIYDNSEKEFLAIIADVNNSSISIEDLTVPEQLKKDIEEFASEEPKIMAPVSLIARTWQARHNSSLNVILSYWAESEDVEIYYNTDEKFYINQPFYYKGTFAEAVNELLMSFGSYSPKPVGKLHVSETGGKPVLVIEIE